jgi:F0F1-type ATP synthase membrane subunit c/vacuolar-type H+-ATPase subunit K
MSRITSLVLIFFLVGTVGERRARAEEVPAPALPSLHDSPKTRVRSPALLGGGIACTAVGLFAGVVGVVFLTAKAEQVPPDSGACIGCLPDDVWARRKTIGGISLGVGVALVAAGLPMMIVGAKRVNLEPAASPPEAEHPPSVAEPKTRQPSMELALSGVRFRF